MRLCATSCAAKVSRCMGVRLCATSGAAKVSRCMGCEVMCYFLCGKWLLLYGVRGFVLLPICQMGLTVWGERLCATYCMAYGSHCVGCEDICYLL